MRLDLAIAKCDDGTYTVVAPMPALIAEARKRTTGLRAENDAIAFAARQYGMPFVGNGGATTDLGIPNVTVITGVTPHA